MIKKIYKIVALIIIVTILHFSLLWIDYYQILHSKSPIFAFKSADCDDGGSVEYTGIGYKIFSHHFITHENVDGRNIDGFMIGPHVEGLPILNFFDQIIAPESLKFISAEDEKTKKAKSPS